MRLDPSKAQPPIVRATHYPALFGLVSAKPVIVAHEQTLRLRVSGFPLPTLKLVDPWGAELLHWEGQMDESDGTVVLTVACASPVSGLCVCVASNSAGEARLVVQVRAVE